MTLPVVVQTPRIIEGQSAPGSNPYMSVAFLDQVHAEYNQRRDAWIREERRLAGTDDVLEELEAFDWETVGGEHYRGRQRIATYPNLALQHASTVTGHLAKHRPLPGKGMDFGNLGLVRPREEIDAMPTRGELAWYNVDGVGADGSQMDAWLDDLDIRAQATGHRWIMVEAPSVAPRSYYEEMHGLRPFAVEYSPLLVTNWYFANGQLRWAVVRVQTQAPKVQGGTFNNTNYNRLGYYLLVAAGEEALGEAYKEGGWWTFTPEKLWIEHQPWINTLGQIPLFRHFGRMSYGTTEKRACSASDTMELGQLGVSMMNTRSAREFDFRDACASKIYFLGADPEVMKVVVDGWRSSSLVAVPPRQNTDGSVSEVTVYDGSAGAVVGTVADALEKAQWETARQLSIAKVTSTPDSSGESKNAGFAEASSPDLARRAMLREQTENTLLYFFELRFGFLEPRAYSSWPKEFDLAPLVDDIDAMFDTLRRSTATSGTMEVELIIQSLIERKLITDDALLATIKTELTAAFTQRQEQAQLDRQLLRGGAGPKPGKPLLGAAGASDASARAGDPPKPPTPPANGSTTPSPVPSTASGSADPPTPQPTGGSNRLPAVRESSTRPIPPVGGSTDDAEPSGDPSPSDRRAPPREQVPPTPERVPDDHPEDDRRDGQGTPTPDTGAIATLTAQMTLILSQMATLQTLILQSQAETEEEPTPPAPAPRNDVIVVPMQSGGDLRVVVERGADNLMSALQITRTGAPTNGQ